LLVSLVTPSVPPRVRAKPWSEPTPGASWRNEAIGDIARNGRGEWKKRRGYHWRSRVENAMYRFKKLTSNRPCSRRVGSQATDMTIRVGASLHSVHAASILNNLVPRCTGVDVTVFQDGFRFGYSMSST